MEALGRPEKRGFFEEDRLPPQLSVKVITLSDVPYESWSDVNLPIDILLIVENDFELSSCLSFLDQPFKSANKEVGHVYFGRIGNASNEEKLKVALVKCSKEAASPEGSLTVAMKAVEILQPKAVFFVGTCIGVSSKKVSLGDVVIPSKLTAAVGSKVLASSRLGDLARDVTNKWVAPLQNPNALEVKVHHSSNILKQSLTVDHTSDDLHELYPEAIAVETEGISLEAYDDIEWVIVKGVTSYFNQTKSSTSGWMAFASTMAASIVASMLKDPVVFQKWSHYSQGYRKFSEARLTKMEERVLMSFKGSPSEMEELQRMISEARLEEMEGYRILSEGGLRRVEERVLKSFKGSPSEMEELQRMISEARLEEMEGYRILSEGGLRRVEERVLKSFKGSPSEMEELQRMISEARLEEMEGYRILSEGGLRRVEERVLKSFKGSPSEMEELERMISEARLEQMKEYTERSQARLRNMEERVLKSFKGSPSEMEELQRMISEARLEEMEGYRMLSKGRLRRVEERVLKSFKGSPSEMEELQRMISEARLEEMEGYRMLSKGRLRRVEERVLKSFKGSPSEMEELQRMISEARLEEMEGYRMLSKGRLRRVEERVLKSFKGSPSEMEELERMISEARLEQMKEYTERSQARLRNMEERVLKSFKGSPSEMEELQRMISEARLEEMEGYRMLSKGRLRRVEERVLKSFKGSPSEMEELQRMISEARLEEMEGYRMLSKGRLRRVEERVLKSFKGSPSEMEELERMISEARLEQMKEYTERSQARLRNMEERVLKSFKGSPSEMEELQRMISEARLEEMEGYRILSEEFRRIPKARSEAIQEFVLRARSFKRSPTEVEEWRSISEEKWKQREEGEGSKTSDVKEGKGDKKAIDEEGRQYGGNEGKDDEGGAEPDKTEIQGQVRYEQDTYDDDLGTQISETTEEDLFHGIHELQMEEQEATERVTIFKGTVTSEGFHVDLNVGAIHLTFPPDAVAEPTDVMVYRWKYGACLPQLTEHEAVVSNVVEISASTEEGGLRFNSEVKLVLSHSAADLEGYELVLKRLTNTETNEWEEIAGCENIRQVSDIEDDYPCPTNVQYSFPVVRAGITKCSTYAVVSRLKLSPAYTITVSGGTFPHPDYPQVTITVPEKAVETETKLSLQLKVQEVPQDKFQGHNLFAGPILHILCSSRAAFLEPVTIQLPLSLGGSMVKFSDPSVCRVRVFFLCSERETKEWIEISDELENPAIYDGKLVKFKVRHFSKLTCVLDWASDSFSAVSSKVTSYLSSITWNPSLVAFFFAYFKPGKSLNGHDILFLTCCPAHLREEVKQEHEREGVTPGVVSSNGKMVPDHDEAFVSVWGGISRPASSGEMEDFSLRLYRDTQHKAQLEVCQESVQAYCGVMFRDKNSNLLAKLHLKLPSPTMDHQRTSCEADKKLAAVASGRVTAGKKELCLPSRKEKPPQLSFKLKEECDFPKSSKPWSDDHLPIDILLLAVDNCDFLSCFSFLDQPFKSYKSGIGYVYFGRMGDASEQEKLKVALMNCSKGAATPGGSLTVLPNAFRVLRPKAVLSVGSCFSLTLDSLRVGDVVISSKLTTAEGYRTPVGRLFGSLIQDAPHGWVAPLANPNELKVKVHRNCDILSHSLLEKRGYDDICEKYPGVVAIETEGAGVYAAAYDANVEWVVVKGVASHFHERTSVTEEWMSFASSMAASVVSKMLNDPTVFREWPHFVHGC
ncbi:uncharacterized protein LOC141886248 isoform X8 [Acropora palmata]|uniref:uncharacterized protein LOC141886248 isoform X8 n=1 Tax=Acropora palmata TaxID=6131 RepID=UPI003DA1B409